MPAPCGKGRERRLNRVAVQQVMMLLAAAHLIREKCCEQAGCELVVVAGERSVINVSKPS